MVARMKAFEKVNKQSEYTWANAFAVGAGVQYLTTPLFKLNLANHNYRFGDSESQRTFFRNIRSQSSEGLIAFLFKAPLSLIVRGGILGIIQLGFFKCFVNYLDEPNQIQTKGLNSSKTQN